MRIFYILILILCWSILILGPINARADDKWSFEKLDGFNYGALAGEVTPVSYTHLTLPTILLV